MNEEQTGPFRLTLKGALAYLRDMKQEGVIGAIERALDEARTEDAEIAAGEWKHFEGACLDSATERACSMRAQTLCKRVAEKILARGRQ